MRRWLSGVRGVVRSHAGIIPRYAGHGNGPGRRLDPSKEL
jgi:hypothetical protein